MLNPPRAQVPSRWRTAIFKGSVALAHELRTIAVISVIIFTLYLQIVATTSKNWDTTRLMGFVQPNVCTASQNTYGVSEYLLINSTKPICFKNNDPSAICFTESFFLESEEFLNNFDIGGDDTLTAFAALFTRATRNYFPLATFTTVIAFISLLLTALYETKDAHFVRGEDGTFFANTRFEKRIIIRINYLLCVALIIMLIIATTFEIYLYQEICPEVYKYQDIDLNFCTMMESAGIGIASVIAPTDVFARNYKPLNIVLAVSLSLGIICRCLTDDFQQDNAQLRILPTNAGNNNDNGDRNILDALAENWREIRLELARVRDDNGVQRYALRERVVRNRRANWKKLPEEEIPSEAECSICLAAVLKRASSGIGLVPTIATGAVEGRNYSMISADEENPNPPNGLNNNEADPSISRQLVSTVRARCGHIFHENCIQEWFQNHNTCPVCRNSLQALEEER
jgi:hypothetical protein